MTRRCSARTWGSWLVVLLAAGPLLHADLIGLAGNLFFDANADGRTDMVLTGNGLGLGLGTTSPSTNLQVAGNAVASGQFVAGGASNASGSTLHVAGTLGFGAGQSLGAGSNTIPGASLVFADTSAGNAVLMLPDAGGHAGQVITVKRTSNLNTLYLGGGGNTLDGSSILTFGPGDYASVTLVSNGSAWYLLANTGNAVATEVTSSNVYLRWKLDETSGTSAADSGSAGTRTGTLQNASFTGNSVAGVQGTALKLVGYGNDAVFHDAGGALPFSAYTYSLWARYNNGTATSVDFEPVASGNAGFMWACANVLYHKSAYHRLSNGTVVSTPLTGNLSADTWYHLACVWDGLSITLYLNGVVQSSNTAISWTGAGNVSLANPGTYATSEPRFDDCRVFNRALTASEIQALYSAGSH